MKTTMKKSVARIITLVMVLAMMMSFAVPAMATSTHNQKVVDAQQAVVQIDIWYVDPEMAEEAWLGGGTGFFINEDTLVTCQHVVTGFSDELYASWAVESSAILGRERTAKEIKENIELRVAVLRDVSVKATIKKASEEMDFAILTLDEKIYNRTTLPLRKGSTANQTEQVYALGFPSIVSRADDQEYRDASDVTSSTGNVNKVTRTSFDVTEVIDPGTKYERIGTRHYNNVDVVEHGARISAGFSGGPLVDAEGNVIGVNAVGNDVGSINMAVSMDPILQTLDALGIDYTEADDAAAAAEAEAAAKAEAEAKAAAEAEAAAKAEAEAKAAAEAEAAAAAAAAAAATEAATEAPTVPAADPNKGGEKPGMDMTTILIIAAVAVVAVVVVIVVVMGKNKKKPAPQPAYAGAGQTAGFQTNSYTAPMGAGETTVLGGDAGETTILGRGGNRGTLIRKRTNETVAITADSFVIGRERSNTNYCVADNSSISRRHASLVTRGGTTFLVDMNAANGTFVNGVKVMPNQEVALKNGDRIKLSDEEFEFRA